MKKPETGKLQSAVIIGLLFSLTACKGHESQQPSDAAATPMETTAVNQPEEVPRPMNLDGQIAAAREDLAARLDIPLDTVVLSGAKRVQWRSGALGCPEPGMMYTEALVPGSVIYLKAGGAIHAYHAKVAGIPFYCPRERVESPAPEGDDDLT